MTTAQHPEVARVDWRGFDRYFFALLLASLVAHFGVVGSMLGRSTGVAFDPEDEIPDRFGQFELVPPKRPPAQRASEAPAPVAARPSAKPVAAPLSRAQLQSKIAQLGIIGALRDGQASSFDALATGGPGADLEDALRNASGVQAAGLDHVGRGDRRGDGTGEIARLGELGTDGARAVDVGSAAHLHVRGTVAPEIVESGPSALDPSAVARYVKSQSRAIQSCYEGQLKLFPALKGKLALRITISAQGRVADSDIDEDTLRNQALVGCVQSRLHFWRFPFQLEHEAAAVLSWSFVPAE